MLGYERVTLGQLISRFSDTDIEYQLLDSDFPHGVFLLGLRLLGNLLAHLWI